MSTTIHVIVASAEEAYNGNAEFWCGGELMAVTTIYDGQLHLQIEPRRDGAPWLINTTSLAGGLDEATRRMAAY
jgi:hypothetical protein